MSYNRRVSLILAALIALASRTDAQPATASPPPAPAPPVAVEEHVVVTGVADSAPFGVTVDPKQPRQPMPAHDGADYLDTVPGFTTVRKGGSGADPVFRGMAGSRVSILADDALLLGGCSARMDTPTAYVFPETFDRITIVKGPQTVKYGAPGSAATVRFERDRTPLAAPGWTGQASLLGGSAGRNDQVVDVRAGTPSFYVRASGSRSAMGDYRGGDGAAVHSRYMRWSTEGAFGWTPDAGTLLEVSVAGSDGHAAYADRGVDGAKFLRRGASVRFERHRQGRTFAGVDASAAVNHVDHVMDNYSLRPRAGTGMGSAAAAMNPDRTTSGGQVTGRWLGSRTSWEAGADLQANRHRNRSSMHQDLVPYDALPRLTDATFLDVGAFVEASAQARPATLVTFGGRVDRVQAHDQRSTIALGMMGAALPNPTADARRTDVLTSGFGRVEQQLRSLPVVAFVGVGHVQRFPDYWELVPREALDGVSAFGTRPEATTQVDVGLQLRRAATTGYVSAFANHVDDFILIEAGVEKPVMMSLRTTAVTRNIDARSAGAEAGVTQRLGLFTADASVAWVRGTNRTDDLPLAQTPPVDARVALAYAGTRLSGGVLVRMAARQDRVAINQGTIVGQDFAATPGFAVTSIHGGWRLPFGATLAAGVDNVFDVDYAEHISRQGAAIPGFLLQTAQLREPGRTLWVRLNVRK